jgi:hypothetical protein
MKRHALDAEIARLAEHIPTLKPRTHDYIRSVERLRWLRIERMRRDKHAGKLRPREKEVA